MDADILSSLRRTARESNRCRFAAEFGWCDRTLELGVDSHVYLANDPVVRAYRGQLAQSDQASHEAQNVVINLAYDAVGTCLSALMLAECGLIADSWCLVRGAFESCCYSEYFALNHAMVPKYMEIAPLVKQLRQGGGQIVNVFQELRRRKIGMSAVRSYLERWDGKPRGQFFARLSSMGTHASPLRAGLRIPIYETEVRSYLSIAHRELPQLLADLGAMANYAVGIPFDRRLGAPKALSMPNEMAKRYRRLEKEYMSVFHSSAGP